MLAAFFGHLHFVVKFSTHIFDPEYTNFLKSEIFIFFQLDGVFVLFELEAVDDEISFMNYMDLRLIPINESLNFIVFALCQLIGNKLIGRDLLRFVIFFEEFDLLI